MIKDTDKKLSELTIEDIDSLPVGPFYTKTRDLTINEMKSGIPGRRISKTYVRPSKVHIFSNHDPICVLDSNGKTFSIGVWSDTNEYFKCPL